MTKDEAWDMIDSSLDNCYSEKDVLEIKEALAQPAQEQSCAKQDIQRHHDYVCGFNEGYDRAEKFYNKGAKS